VAGGTAVVLEDDFEFAGVEDVDSALLAFEGEVVSFDELVLDEAGDQVSLADSFRALDSPMTTIIK
jgi:hypothetical protein